MAPPKAVCQVYADGLNAYATILETWESVKKTIAELRATLAKIAYGIIDVADFASAEILNAIGAIATTIAQSVASAVSGAAASLIETILSEILTILLAFPTAIFSLVAIPHQQASSSLSSERIKLTAARSNITTVLRIISKWTSGMGGTEFYRQIKSAIPYIEKAIKHSNEMIQQLAGTLEYDGGGRNAEFNEGVYRSMKAEIRQAMEILKPKSFIVDKSKILPLIQKNQQKKRNEAVAKINAQYEIDKRRIDEGHASALKSIPDGYTSQRIIAQEKSDNLWAWHLKRLDDKRKEDIAKVECESMRDLELNKGTYYAAKDGLQAEFSYDMEILGNNLLSFLNNVRYAFEDYKTSQMACYTCYNMRGLIRGIIHDIIALLRGTGNAAAVAVIESLRLSQASLRVADNRLLDAKSKYESTPRSISATQMSIEAMTGYGLVSSADALTSATITQSLADLINADSVVDAANDDFDRFIGKLELIHDWDGRQNIWAPDPVAGVVSPYIQIIADATSLLAMVPTIGISNNPDHQKMISDKVRRMKSNFSVLLQHNSEVQSAISSYSPYIGTQAGNLMRILSKAGLLGTFAIGMNLEALVSGIVKSAMSFDVKDFPSFENCYGAYGDEMFPDIKKSAGAVASRKMSLPAKETFNKFTERLESKLYKQKQVDVNLKKSRFLDGHSKDDLLQDEDATAEE